MHLINWSPFGELDSLIDRYARDLAHARESSAAEATWRPASSIVENRDEYVITADLPAVSREDVSVTVESNVLTIRGERRLQKTADEETAHRRESFFGVFERKFSLPEDVDPEAISAESKDGVLTVRIPRLRPVQPEVRQITVN